MSVKSFVEKLNLKNNNTNKLIVYLDSKIYPNEFGISVRPLLVKYGSTIIDMKQLIEIFDKYHTSPLKKIVIDLYIEIL